MKKHGINVRIPEGDEDHLAKAEAWFGIRQVVNWKKAAGLMKGAGDCTRLSMTFIVL